MRKRIKLDWIFLTVLLAFTLFVGGFYIWGRTQTQGVLVVTERDGDEPMPEESEDPAPGILEGERIDLNTASAGDLDRLPGIGPARAEAIISHRETNGPFTCVEDLMEVKGIGEGILNGLRDYVTVGDE